MKRRSGDPWMPASAYGKSLSGLSINLLVRDIEAALLFQQQVLGVTIVYQDPDFAVLRGYDSEWILHADHTYQDHKMRAIISEVETRGAGVELRLHNGDPDAVEAAARKLDFIILDGATDKAHGLREVFIADADGYIWVIDSPLE